MYKLKYNPVVVGSGTLVDYRTIKGAISDGLYDTKLWSSLANAFHGLLTGNLTAAAELTADPESESVFPNNGPEARFGIRCSDSSLRTNNLTELYPLIDEFQAKSTLLGDMFSVIPLTCGQWPFHAKERYTGNFHVKTKHPLLFIGNTFDPATPLVSAQNVSAGFEGSVVLQHDGYGVSLEPSQHAPVTLLG